LQVEIEVESIQELSDALTGSPDWVLLDNMSSELMRQCALMANGKCKLEASGGIGLDRMEEISRTGVDAVSLGCLTHSVKSADLSLELVEER
jgi:nicotinate-nucleotide pyrophosphorylase (carboxylating)